MKAAVEKSGNIEPEDLDDVMIGCSFPKRNRG
jgi:acetyl-CoA acetyltransferase